MKNKSAERVFEQKREASAPTGPAPFEKKIEIVVELQKAAAGIRQGPRHIIWQL